MPPPDFINRLNPQMLALLQQQQGPQRKPGGLSGLLNSPGFGPGLLQTGLGLLAQADRPGSLAGALGRALPGGIQAGKQASREAQLAEMFKNAPPQLQQLFDLLGPEEAAKIIGGQIAAGPAAPVSLVKGAKLVNPTTGADVASNIQPETAEPGQALNDAALELFGTATIGDLTTDQLREAGDLVQRRAVERAQAGVQPLPDVLRAKASESLVGGLEKTRNTASLAVGALARLDEAERVLSEGDPFTGTGAELFTAIDALAAQFGFSSGDRAADTQQLMLVFKTNALDFLQNFPGQLSEKELEAAQFLAGDVNLQPATIQQVIDSARLVAEGQIERHNAQVDTLFPAGASNDDLRRGLIISRAQSSLLSTFGITPVNR